MVKIIGKFNLDREKNKFSLVLKTQINWAFKEKFKEFFDSLENPALLKDQQNLLEIDTVLHWIEKTFDKDTPMTYVEVGSYAGESLFFISQVLPKGSHIILVDYGDHPIARKLLFQVIDWVRINLEHKVDLLQKDSTDLTTVDLVQELMKESGRKRANLCFIDANHMFEYAFRDFKNFSFISDWILFHDISEIQKESAASYYGLDQAMVRHLWKVLYFCFEKRTDEIIDDVSDEFFKPRGFGILDNRKYI